MDLTQPYHEYVTKEGKRVMASPTVDSLLRARKARKAKKGRVVIRHKREL